jgi:plastocyanin
MEVTQMSYRAPQATAARKSIVMLLALTGGLLALAGCGGSSSSSSSSASTSPATTSSSSTPTSSAPSSSGAATKLSLSADPGGQLKYSTSSLAAKAGKVSIDFTNMSPLSHSVTVASSSGAVIGATPTFQGSSKTVSLQLKPGTYTFYCSVPGHRAAGMQGTITVSSSASASSAPASSSAPATSTTAPQSGGGGY